MNLHRITSTPAKETHSKRSGSGTSSVYFFLAEAQRTQRGDKLNLEERLHRSVDLVTYRNTMTPFLKHKIDGDVVYA